MRRQFGFAAWPERRMEGSVDDLVLSDQEIMDLLRHVPRGPMGSLLRAALVWRRTTSKVGQIVGGATASFVQHYLQAGKSEEWILANYRKHVRRVVRAELNRQQDEFDEYAYELHGLRR